MSAFDHRALDLPQFLQLLDTFLGEAAPDYVVQSLVGYLRVGYRETEQERLMRLEKVACGWGLEGNLKGLGLGEGGGL